MRELPYDFDLLHDIKMMYQVEAIAKGEPSCSDATPEDLLELFIAHQLPIPACLQNIKISTTGKDILLVVVIKDSLVDMVHACENVKEQEEKFKEVVLEKTGFSPEDCDYEDGYYEYEIGGSICLTSLFIGQKSTTP